MTRTYSRRGFFKATSYMAAVPFAGLVAGNVVMAAADKAKEGAKAKEDRKPKPKWAKDHPSAGGFQYVSDNTKLKKKNAAKGDVQLCSNCVLWQNKRTIEVDSKMVEVGDCALFSGHLVPAKAWCVSYAPKS